ncbi:hypothetical protein [uncultured Xanthomonas sp.]|uniref:hypothetical protein n=1 Tax=uncultured Xanthomonas sp. TaxID=152831 RepID=UPI003747E600
MVSEILRWDIEASPIDTGGVTKLVKNISRYSSLAKIGHVLCIADTDGKCAVKLLSTWRPSTASERFILRLAVNEAESWLLADDDGFSDYFGISRAKIPRSPDEVVDPKREVVNLVRSSNKRALRNEVVSSFDSGKPGVGYNIHLQAFVNGSWSPRRAAEKSPSLHRAIRHLDSLLV